MWLPLTTLIIGLLGGAALEWLRDERAYRRTREGRRDLHLQQRRDKHREFQRETALGLQEAVQKFARAVGATYHQDQIAHASSGVWARQPVTAEWDDALFEGNVALLKLSSRVEDDQLREWVTQMRELFVQIMVANSKVDASNALDAILALTQSINEQIGLSLRSRPEGGD